MNPPLYTPVERYADYGTYLAGAHWRRLRSAKLSRHSYCQVCGKRERLEVHHLLYRRGWEGSKVMDLMTLCDDCHDLIHVKLKSGEMRIKPEQTPREIMRATRRFLRMSLDADYWQWNPHKRYSAKRRSKLEREFNELRDSIG